MLFRVSRPHRATPVGVVPFAFVALLLLAGCVPLSPLAVRTPTPQPTPTAIPTSTPTPTPLPTATPLPTPTPTIPPQPTPAPPPTQTTVCIPGPGVTPASSAVVFIGNSSKRQVSLTFDSDGGPAGNARSYLDTLRDQGIHATWFLTGDFAQANPAVVRQIAADGHEIGNHTVDHPDLISPPRSDAFICSELVNANRIISSITGNTTRPYFRPPYGDYNTQVRTLAAQLGYRTFYWSIDPADWDSSHTAQYIENNIFSNLRPGAIILMHVNSAHEAEALPAVIAGIEQRGYRIVPLGQLLA